ncbi:MAG: hypothetical protein U0802_21115 [Candidatus Binatia bacterium]
MPEQLPVLPLLAVVVFPSAIVPLLISRGTSLKAMVEQALSGDRMLALVTRSAPRTNSRSRRTSTSAAPPSASSRC